MINPKFCVSRPHRHSNTVSSETNPLANLVESKKEFSEPQIWISSMDEIKVFVRPGENVEIIERMVDQVCRILSATLGQRLNIWTLGWFYFWNDQKVQSGIQESDKSKTSSIDHVGEDRFQLQKEEAALKAKLVYVEKERILRLGTGHYLLPGGGVRSIFVATP